MAKWDFKIVGASFVKELTPVSGDVQPRSQSFMQPSFDLEGDKIVMKESGQYKTSIGFTQIGEIDGVVPTDIEDAYAKLLVLVENFNGGGGTPGTTPNLTQVITEDDISIYLQPLTQNVAFTIPLLWQVSQAYVYGLGPIGTGGVFLDKTILFSNNATLRFCWGYQSDSLDTKTPESFLFTTNAKVYYDGGLITSLVIAPADLVMVKSGGIISGENYWILTITNKNSGGAWGSITGTLSSQTDLQSALNAKENITTATTGAVISFVNPQVYNSIASPSSSNITDNLTGARIGVVQKIYHNSGTAPTFPAGWVRRGTGIYVTSTLNIIYAEWSVGTTVEYWITQ